jgi:hypothetical protein
MSVFIVQHFARRASWHCQGTFGVGVPHVGREAHGGLLEDGGRNVVAVALFWCPSRRLTRVTAAAAALFMLEKLDHAGSVIASFLAVNCFHLQVHEPLSAFVYAASVGPEKPAAAPPSGGTAKHSAPSWTVKSAQGQRSPSIDTPQTALGLAIGFVGRAQSPATNNCGTLAHMKS